LLNKGILTKERPELWNDSMAASNLFVISV
jgi:hypothetical protein